MFGLGWVGDKNINLKMIKTGLAESFVEYLNDPFY